VLPPEVVTIAAKLTSSGPVPDVPANFTAVGSQLAVIPVDFAPIPPQFPSLMEFHPLVAEGAVRSDPLSVEVVAERQGENGGQAERHASHRYLSVMSEPAVLLNHTRET
jgi:hypothetical protein